MEYLNFNPHYGEGQPSFGDYYAFANRNCDNVFIYATIYLVVVGFVRLLVSKKKCVQNNYFSGFC